ncbi:hypothetical protein V1478_014764 [Vespula squamosa]|uniref:Uncharacterized protein n=1 Tax=Vespula squamosa TaxID=30214 RepID=A0ABD2A364_VESSQ
MIELTRRRQQVVFWANGVTGRKPARPPCCPNLWQDSEGVDGDADGDDDDDIDEDDDVGVGAVVVDGDRSDDVGGGRVAAGGGRWHCSCCR